MFHFTALGTCLAISLYFFTSIRGPQARATFGIKVPAISGNPDFERVFRVQMNTLEWMPIFLPSLWLFAIYISDAVAAVVGLVWIAGRILYITGYSQAAAKRGRGFGIQASAAIILGAGRVGRDSLAPHSCITAGTPPGSTFKRFPARHAVDRASASRV